MILKAEREYPESRNCSQKRKSFFSSRKDKPKKRRSKPEPYRSWNAPARRIFFQNRMLKNQGKCFEASGSLSISEIK